MNSPSLEVYKKRVEVSSLGSYRRYPNHGSGWGEKNPVILGAPSSSEKLGSWWRTGKGTGLWGEVGGVERGLWCVYVCVFLGKWKCEGGQGGQSPEFF